MRKGTSESDHILLKIMGIMLLALAISSLPLLLPHARPIPAAPSATASSIDAYRGLATWVSMFEPKAWANPQATVTDMASHGVHTVFIETGNSTSKTAIFDPEALDTFIQAAHAHGMKVVAWYLPDMVDITSDYDRIAQAIGFTTSDGQTFDSFALDIESTAIRQVGARNLALNVLSLRIRDLVGTSYKIGAIVPSPVVIAKNAGFWNAFPYGSVAKTFDVLVPMGYYTYDGHGAAAAAADVSSNVRILRAQPGCANVPIHLIGGLAAKSTPADVSAFAIATRSRGCIGASLYSWSSTTAAEWEALQSVNR